MMHPSYLERVHMTTYQRSPSIEELHRSGTETFLTQCASVLRQVQDAINAEHQRRLPFLPLPHNFLRGAETVQGDLFPLLRECEVILAQPVSDARTARINDLLLTILRLGTYHLVLAGGGWSPNYIVEGLPESSNLLMAPTPIPD